jgi:hypothetical protein
MCISMFLQRLVLADGKFTSPPCGDLFVAIQSSAGLSGLRKTLAKRLDNSLHDWHWAGALLVTDADRRLARHLGTEICYAGVAEFGNAVMILLMASRLWRVSRWRGP